MHRQALLASLPMTLTESSTGTWSRCAAGHAQDDGQRHPHGAADRRVARHAHPALVFGGRRGQLMTLDIFDNDLGNYNFAIIGAPGSASRC